MRQSNQVWKCAHHISGLRLNDHISEWDKIVSDFIRINWESIVETSIELNIQESAHVDACKSKADNILIMKKNIIFI